MGQIVYGSELAKKMRLAMSNEISEMKRLNMRPVTLAVVLVGDNPASISYVSGKKKACDDVGIVSRMIELPSDCSEMELLNKVKQLNGDDEVDGILVQLPLPSHINEKTIIQAISPKKDVDGLHPENVAKLVLGESGLRPCTPLGVMEILKEMNVDVCGKNVVVIGRSQLVGKPVANLLVEANATVTVCHSKTNNLREVCKRADVLVVAIGRAKMIDRSYVKDGAIVIDVGVNRVDGKLCGDVDFDDVVDVASFITPVPKGVGPMTITMLLHNTLMAYKGR